MADHVKRPTEQDIEWLRQDPRLHSTGFEQVFGAGSAASFLTPAVQPASPPPLEAPVEEPEDEPGLMGRIGAGAVDVGRGAVHGVQEAANETIDALEAFDVAASKKLDEWGIPSRLQITNPETGKFDLDLKYFHESEGDNDWLGGKTTETGDGLELDIASMPVTGLGEVSSSITQFIAGFYGAKKITGIGGWTGGFVNGAIADGVVFDPDDANLSRFMADNDFAVPLLTEALATDPDDPEWMNRMRNVTEGVVAGAVLETTLKGLRAMAKMKVGVEKGDELLIKEAQELADEAGQEARKALDEGVPAKSPERPKAAAEEAVEEAAPETRQRAFVDLGGILAKTDKITVDDLDNARAFNFDKMDGPMSGKVIIQSVAEEMETAGVSKALGLDKPETLEATLNGAKAELSDILEVGLDDFSDRVATLAEGGRDQAKMLVAGKMALQSFGREISTLAAKIDADLAVGKEDPEMMDRLFSLMDTHVDLQSNLKAVQTQAARLVSAGRITTDDALGGADVNRLNRIAQHERVLAKGGTKQVRKMVRAIQAAKTPKQKAKMIRTYQSRTKGQKTMDVINEVFINNILSGYKTHLMNVTSNTLNVAYLPFERTVGGLMDGVRGNKEGWAEARKGLYQYVTMREAVFDAVRLSGRVLKSENPVLDSAIKLDYQEGYGRAITPENFGIDNNSVGGKLVAGVGHAMRLPGRFLMAEDEFFKQIMFRSRLKANLMVDASRMSDDQIKAMGYKNKGEFVESEIEKSINGLQDLEDEWALHVQAGHVKDDPKAKAQFIRQNIGSVKEASTYAKDALRLAREATFTTPVQKGTITESYMKMANRHPVLRQITPFIQTPTNILSKAFDRTPGINLVRQRYRDRLMSSDAAVRAEALGELSTGVAVSAALYFMALEGRITGGGPTDRRRRELWQNDKSWQRYSLNVGSAEEPHWVAFDRMDPWATAFGIAGDVAEMAQAAQADPSFNNADAFTMILAAVSNNVVSKTYMQGLADVFEVVNGKGNVYGAQNVINNKLASFVPFSSAQRQLGALRDPHLKEARDLTDRLKQNVYGLGEDLPTKYNWITGEALERPEHLLGYIQSSRTDHDTVAEELRRLNYGFVGPDRRIGMVELSSEQYHEWSRLMGTVKIGGRTLMASLERQMNKSRYDLGREKVPDGVVAPSESHRVRMLSEVISAYKERAKFELMEQNPDLLDAWEATMQFQGDALRGRVNPGDRDLLKLKF